jgi:2-keto-4-pentenoate hydratase
MLAEQLAGKLGRVVGWKVGATSPGAQAFLGVSEPIYGRIFEGGLWATGQQLQFPGARPAEAEPEILVRIGRDPGAELEQGDIDASHIGMEVNRPSRDDALSLGTTFIVADNAANLGLVIGPTIDLHRLKRPEEIKVQLFRSGIQVSCGDASAVLGDPLESVRWLIRQRAGTRRPVRAGDWIATGAMSRAAPLGIGDEVMADFGAFGTVAAGRITAAKVMPTDYE